MKPEGRTSVVGVVRVSRLRYRVGRWGTGKLRESVTVYVEVPDDDGRRFENGDRGWFVWPPRRRSAWPEAAACEGHRVKITATFEPLAMGARAMRAHVECADEAEHVLGVLADL